MGAYRSGAWILPIQVYIEMIRQNLLCGQIVYPPLIFFQKSRKADLSCSLMPPNIRKPAVLAFQVADSRIQRRIKACIISISSSVYMIKLKTCFKPHDLSSLNVSCQPGIGIPAVIVLPEKFHEFIQTPCILGGTPDTRKFRRAVAVISVESSNGGLRYHKPFSFSNPGLIEIGQAMDISRTGLHDETVSICRNQIHYYIHRITVLIRRKTIVCHDNSSVSRIRSSCYKCAAVISRSRRKSFQGSSACMPDAMLHVQAIIKFWRCVGKPGTGKFLIPIP